MNETQIQQPVYMTKQPSTGKTIKFRPYTVKEEKSLLLALEEKNIVIIAENISNIIRNCTLNAIDPAAVPYYDIEYIYLQIRAKSVGEIIELTGSCSCSDKIKTDFYTDIADTIVEPKPSGMAMIKIPDTDYTIQLSHPSIIAFSKSIIENGSEESAIEVVADSIKTVFNNDEQFDWSLEKKIEFVESMSPKQQKDIGKFLSNMPLVSLPTKYKCKACQKEHTGLLTGFENFFV